MRILITGGCGYIGSHTAKLLHAQGHEIVVLDNLSRGNRWAAKWGLFEQADIHDLELLTKLFVKHRIESVVHFAAFAYVGESVATPELYFYNNVAGTFSLIRAMQLAGVNLLVFSSSCAVYGNPLFLPLTEEHPLNPCNPYGETKAAVERALSSFGEGTALRWVALRYFNAAGSDPELEVGEAHDPETHLIPLLLRSTEGAGATCSIYGTDYPTPDGTCIRDYIHVADLARAHSLAISFLQGGGASQPINLGTGCGYSIREVIDTVREETGAAPLVRFEARRFGDPAALVANGRRAAELLGWEPRCSSLPEIVRTAWQWRQVLRARSANLV